MVEHFMIYFNILLNNAGVLFFDTQCKIAAQELTIAGFLFYQNSQATYVNIGNFL